MSPRPPANPSVLLGRMTDASMSGHLQNMDLLDGQGDGIADATSLDEATQLQDTLSPTGGHGDQQCSGADPQTLSQQLQSLIDGYRSNTATECDIKDALFQLGAQACETQEYESDPKYAMFKECLDQGGDFGLRNDRIGREWNKAVAADPALRKSYTKCSGQKDKAAMRKSWVDRMCSELRYGKSHIKRWEKVDITNGDYYAFGGLVESYGIHYDRQAAVEAATKHAEKCIKMAGPWLRFNKMGEVMEYLKLSVSFTERMSEAWSLWEEENSGSGDATAGKPDVRKSPANPKSSASCSTPGAGNDSTGGRKRAGCGDGGSAQKKPKKNECLEKALAVAVKVKKLHTEATSRAENIVGLIDTCSDWAWARTQDAVGTLRDLIMQMKAKRSTAVNRFILEDIKVLRREIGGDYLLAMANEFIALKPSLEAIDAKQIALLSAHKSMLK